MNRSLIDLVARLRDNVRYALRGYRRYPGFTILATLTLALGIGANSTIFGVVDRLLLRAPAHVRDPESVVRFITTARGVFSPEPFTTPLGDYKGYAALRDGARSYDNVAGFMTREVTMGLGSEARLVNATFATASLFPLIGLRPILGRFYSTDEDAEGAAPVIVLGEDLWRSQFAGDPAALGRLVTIQGTKHSVVGVAPRGFTGVDLGKVDAWLPLHSSAPAAFGHLPGLKWKDLGGYWMSFVARLKPGVTTARASAEATVLISNARGPNVSVGNDLRVSTASIIPGRDGDRSEQSRIAVWLAAMAALVLLVACANVANLLLARSVARQREIAVRLAIGATRHQLFAQLLTEGLVLAVFGGAAALVATYWTAGALRAVLLPDVAWDTSPVDGRVFAATAVVALATGIIASVVPALRASRPDVTGALKLGERSGGSVTHTATRTSLVIAQSALCVVLLVSAGLFVRSLYNLKTTDLGLDAERTLVVDMQLAATTGFSQPQVAAFYDKAAEAVRPLPGIERVSMASSHPFGHGYGGGLTIPGRDSLPTAPTGGPYEFDVSPGYFATLGTQLRRGRDFTDADRKGAQPVLIVNEALAQLYWPGVDAIGQCARISGRGDACAEIVGVVATSHRSGIRESPSLVYYVPLLQSLQSYTGRTRSLLMRTAPGADARAVARLVQRRVQSLEANLPFVKVVPLSDLLASDLQSARLGAVLFGVFGALALTIAAVGLYGVVSFGVTQRRRELGVRMALGARQSDILGLILGTGVRHALIGILLGLAVAYAGAPRLESLLYEVSPRDGIIMGSVALLLFAVSVVACVAPAWQATRVDPAMTLRSE